MALVQAGKYFNMEKSFDRAMKEKNRDGHEFRPMQMSNMEHICDICYMAHKVGA